MGDNLYFFSYIAYRPKKAKSTYMETKSLTLTFTVSANHLAQAIGSGDMPVLGTPAMIAMMENTCMKLAAADLSDGDTTVGSLISASHLRPSALGATISVTATLDAVDGRKLDFTVVAKDGDNVISEAKHTRFIVSRERFLSKLGK